MVNRNNIKPAHPKVAVSSVPIHAIFTKILPAVFIVIALLGVFLHKINSPAIEKARVFFTDMVTPILSTISTPIKNAALQIEGVANIRDLKAENIRLQEENMRLQQWYDIALKLEAENRGLKSLLNFQATQDYKYLSTRIVADPGGNFVKTVLIPIGSLDGVKKGQAVIGKKALIGRVIEVGKNASRILMITDLNSRLPVTIENTRTRAILSGNNTNIMSLEHMPLDSKVKIGARVVTSGDGGVLPPNLPVGKIVSSDSEKIQVMALDNLKQTEYVKVVDFFINDALLHGNIE